MKAMIRDCKKHHRHALPSPAYIPKRLLGLREVHPKLISCRGLMSGSLGQTPRYAALSYCWGTPEEAAHQSTTTRQTMPERQRGIRYDEMPPVLRDAICVTKSLEIPFLWIDALCITPGDQSDWEKQCAQMDEHSEVTLLASSSNSCRESFLHPEAPSTTLPFSSKRQPLVGGLLRIRFSGFTKASLSEAYYSDMNDSRLATRGWAVQERILSSRMIIFGRSNVHFMCPSYPSWKDHRNRNYWICKFREAENESPHNDWTELLDKYQSITADSFTRSTDLVPALSGLAACFGSRTKDRYCAGHWHRELYRSLMWYIAKTLRRPQARHIVRACSPSPYIVPSWSRLGKGVSHAFDQYLSGPKQDTLRLDAHISQTGENPFGAIRYAELEVRTHTMCLQTAFIKLDNVFFRDRSHHPFLGLGESHQDVWLVGFLQRDKSVPLSLSRRNKYKFNCCVWVDYDLRTEDFRRDAEEWKWALLGLTSQLPFGLLLSSADKLEWCGVGVFAPWQYGENDCRSMTLRDITQYGSVETVTIV